MTSTRDYQSARFADHRLDIQDPRYRKFSAILRGMKPGAVLEVGCSGGEYLEVLHGQGWKVEGIEVSEAAARRGIARGLSIHVADATQPLPCESGRFDVVIAGEVIEHTFDDLAFLRECHRVLKPGGTLVLSTPNLTSLKNRFLMLLGLNPRFALADYHYRVYTIHILRSLLARSPFRRVGILGSYVIYSRSREPVLGGLLEWLGNMRPSWAEHFIVVAKKESG